jgi:hypothetical protein
MSAKRPASPHTWWGLPIQRPEKRVLPGWMYHPAFLWALTVAAVPALVLGWLMPLRLAFQPTIRTPYELPAQHAVFVHTSTAETDCTITENGAETFHMSIAKSGPLPFSGFRVPPRATAGATLKCTSRVVVTVDPDWRYPLANSQPAKWTLTLFGFFGLAWIYFRVRTWFRRWRYT